MREEKEPSEDLLISSIFRDAARGYVQTASRVAYLQINGSAAFCKQTSVDASWHQPIGPSLRGS
jgi:hypothetical protein